MDLKDYLTNEKVNKKFSSQFESVLYAIKLATNMIQSGRECRVKVDSQNRAMQVLTEILNNKDQFDEIIAEPKSYENGQSFHTRDEPQKGQGGKHSERKKNRKILAD